MKNRGARHDWEVTGGYDPERDGADPQWARIAISCRTCGEKRRIGSSLDNPAVAYGCRRTGGDEWQKGDLLVRGPNAAEGRGSLDEFECWLPDGKVRTYNAGGDHHQVEVSELRAAP